MFRFVCSALSRAPLTFLKNNIPKIPPSFIPGIESNKFHSLNNINIVQTQPKPQLTVPTGIFNTILLKNVIPQLHLTPSRSVIKFSLKKGKRKTVKTVLKRFKRLDWGIWIRTMAGRHKSLWRKRAKRRLRLTNHVFTSASQSYMLDKMVTAYWRKPKYWVDDPYEPYHKREEFYATQKKPRMPK